MMFPKVYRVKKPRKPLKSGGVNRADAQWASTVKERDDWTCQRCGRYDLNNDAHHIAPRGRAPELRRDLLNGTTLCRSCHRWVHSHPIQAAEAGLLAAGT